MRFVILPEAAERLRELGHQIDPERACYVPGTDEHGERKRREFSGPSVTEGLLGGFPRGVLGWAKKALKVQRTEQLDLVESRLLYFVIAIRNVDHKLLPIEWFDDLTLTDFQLVKHVVTSLDQDGDCGECNMTLDNDRVHIPADPDAAEVPPTKDPAGPATNETETS